MYFHTNGQSVGCEEKLSSHAVTPVTGHRLYWALPGGNVCGFDTIGHRNMRFHLLHAHGILWSSRTYPFCYLTFVLSSTNRQTLTDLNDFISPSQACIKPVEQIKPPQSDVVPGAASVSCILRDGFKASVLNRLFLQTEIRIDATGDYYEVSNEAVTSSGSSGKKLAQAQISLNDCLACR
jgi:hypothetical protein